MGTPARRVLFESHRGWVRAVPCESREIEPYEGLNASTYRLSSSWQLQLESLILSVSAVRCTLAHTFYLFALFCILDSTIYNSFFLYCAL